MVFNTNPFSDFHFAAPQSGPPVTMPINRTARFSPPAVPNELRGVTKAQPIPKLPHGTFYNLANPGRLKISRP